MADPWPMIAGVGAGVAAAAAVGQMIVSAVALGQQSSDSNAQNREIEEIKNRLAHLQQLLKERGYHPDSDNGNAEAARDRATQIRSMGELKTLELSLEERVGNLLEPDLASNPAAAPPKKSRFVTMMEERGRRFLG